MPGPKTAPALPGRIDDPRRNPDRETLAPYIGRHVVLAAATTADKVKRDGTVTGANQLSTVALYDGTDTVVIGPVDSVRLGRQVVSMKLQGQIPTVVLVIPFGRKAKDGTPSAAVFAPWEDAEATAALWAAYTASLASEDGAA